MVAEGDRNMYVWSINTYIIYHKCIRLFLHKASFSLPFTFIVLNAYINEYIHFFCLKVYFPLV
jgi:hypothetical protein